MSKTALVVGSLHYDIMVDTPHLPRPDETAVGHRWYPKFGGKGGNQAAALAKAGAPTRFAGAVGEDDFGDMLLATLDAAGVDRRFVARLSGIGSGMSVALVEDGGDYAAVIVSGANTRIAAEALADAALWDGVGLLVLQNEVPDAVNIAAADAARTRGVTVLLNAAPARAVVAGLADVLVVNAVEAEMLGGGAVADLSNAATAAQQLSGLAPTVIVTAGGAGLAFVAPGEHGAIAAERVEVVSTHGAGDAFIGALGAGLLAGLTMGQAAAAASHAAALHVSRQRSAS